jgi:nucleoside-diphosphate-sugar epimerase
MDQYEFPPAPTLPGPVVVLGGTGFVGRQLSSTLEDLGVEVVRVARHAGPGHGGPPVRELDLVRTGAEAIACLLTEVRAGAVVNAAGGDWGRDGDELVMANSVLVGNVLAAIATMRRPPRLVQLGSVHEYGLAPIGTSFREPDEPCPVGIYAREKVRCTDAVLAASGRGEVDGVVLRAGNITGAGQPPASLLGVVADRLQEARDQGRVAAIRMRSLGALRDFVTLPDAVGAVLSVLTTAGTTHRLFNIGTGRASRARDLVRMLVEVSGVPADVVETEPETVETTWQQMCVDRARVELGWMPRHDTADGVKQLWEHRSRSANRR